MVSSFDMSDNVKRYTHLDGLWFHTVFWIVQTPFYSYNDFYGISVSIKLIMHLVLLLFGFHAQEQTPEMGR